MEGTLYFLALIAFLAIFGGINFVAGRRYERDKWALCRDCADIMSTSDIQERDGLCRDCRRKLWGEMAF